MDDNVPSSAWQHRRTPGRVNAQLEYFWLEVPIQLEGALGHVLREKVITFRNTL